MDRDTYNLAGDMFQKISRLEKIIECLEKGHEINIGAYTRSGDSYAIYKIQPEDRAVLLEHFKAKKEQLEKEVEKL